MSQIKEIKQLTENSVNKKTEKCALLPRKRLNDPEKRPCRKDPGKSPHRKSPSPGLRELQDSKVIVVDYVSSCPALRKILMVDRASIFLERINFSFCFLEKDLGTKTVVSVVVVSTYITDTFHLCGW